MANDVEVRIVAKGDLSALDKAQSKITGFANKADSAGRQTSIGMRSASQALEALGADQSLLKITSQASNAADTVGDLAGAFMTFNPAVLAMTAVVGGIALMAAALDSTNPALKELNAQFDSLSKQDDTVKALADLSNVTTEQARTAIEAAKDNAQYRDSLRGMLKEAQGKSSIEMLGEVSKDLNKIWVDRDPIMQYAKSLGVQYRESKQASQATKELANEVVKQGVAVDQTNKMVDRFKQAIPQAAAEQKQFNQQITELGTSHKKAMAGFSADVIKAEANAGKERTKIAQETTAAIVDIEQNAAERKADAYRDYTRTIAEMDRDRAQSARDLADERSKLETDAAKDIARINKDLADELAGINRDSVEEETGAKSYAEVLRIRRDAEQRRADAQKKADEAKAETQTKLGEAQTELNEKKRKADEEFAYKRGKLDEDYRYNEGIRARETAQAIASAREREQAQIAATNERLANEKTAIEERRLQEIASYNEAITKAREQHAERIQQITDTRTEAQKLSADMATLADPAWQPWINKANEYKGVMNTLMGWNPTGGNIPWAFGTGNDSTRGYATGGVVAGPIGAPQLAVVHGGEEVLTPAQRNARGSTRGGVNITIAGNVYGVTDLERTIAQAIDRYDRGL